MYRRGYPKNQDGTPLQGPRPSQRRGGHIETSKNKAKKDVSRVVIVLIQNISSTTNIVFMLTSVVQADQCGGASGVVFSNFSLTLGRLVSAGEQEAATKQK